MKGFTLVIKLFFSLLKKVFAKPAKMLIRLIKLLIIKTYKVFYLLKKIKNKIFPTEKIRPVYVIFNKYITHTIIILLTVSISFANFFSSETKAESVGEQSILFALTTGSDLEDVYIEETIESAQPTVDSYNETESASISVTPQILSDEKIRANEKKELVSSANNSALIKQDISSVEASKTTRDKIIEYEVQSGDTISTIAQNFGVSVQTVTWANNLSKFTLIKPGQKLEILPISGIAHEIAKGDTINSISKKYQADKEKIIEFNKLADESDIQVDLVLIIPEGQPYYVPPKKLAAVSQIFKPTHVNVPSGSKMSWPTTSRRISQYYSFRHHGLDIDGEFGDPIWAADDGIVTKVAYLNYSYGYHVIVDHGGGKTTLYAHFQKIYVKQGQRVARGDVLGEQGSTGYSTGSHLHLEVRFGGKRYNPISYIR